MKGDAFPKLDRPPDNYNGLALTVDSLLTRQGKSSLPPLAGETGHIMGMTKEPSESQAG